MVEIRHLGKRPNLVLSNWQSHWLHRQLNTPPRKFDINLFLLVFCYSFKCPLQWNTNYSILCYISQEQFASNGDGLFIWLLVPPQGAVLVTLILVCDCAVSVSRSKAVSYIHDQCLCLIIHKLCRNMVLMIVRGIKQLI